MKKQCPNCKNIEEFYKNQSWCVNCQKEYKKSHTWKQIKHKNYLMRKERNHELLKRLKINGCAICGYDKNFAALDFHHVNPEDKKYAVAFRLMDYSDNIIIEELNKCILLCSNCHREIHNTGLMR